MAEASVPMVVSWNLTRRCNLACGHCYLDAQQRLAPDEPQLDTARCLQIAAGIAAVNPECVLILTGGEPLLRPDVFELARGAADLGLFVVLGTNGTLLTPARVRAARDSGLRGFGVSLDSPSAPAHDQLRGVPGAWDGAMRGISNLRAEGLPFLVQYTLLRAGQGELDAMARLATELGAMALNVYYLVCTGRGQSMVPLTPDDYERSLEELYQVQQQYRGRLMVNAKCAPHFKRVVHQHDPGSPSLQSHEGGCPAGTSYARITPEGLVTACPYLPTVEADLATVGFAEAWRREGAFAQLRQRSHPGRCGACEYSTGCGGCRARALATTGQLMDDDPWCTYQPRPGAERVTPAKENTYTADAGTTLEWTEEARGRIARIPLFARGMVTRRVEAWCLERGVSRVTPEILTVIRERMGTGPPFARPGGGR